MLSDDEIRELVIKKSRRDLLAVLKIFYPANADYETLRLTLPTVEERYLKVDLSYLIDKGYVEWVNKRANAAWPDREYRLTATGVETADRINKDPAL